MKLLKRTAFSLLGILLLILTIATILEKIYGTDFVNEYIYSSVPFVILCGVTAITSLIYIIKSKLHRQPVIFLLHLSLLFILAGAFTTWIYGEQGTMRVRQGEQQTSFTDSKGISHQLPFSITLNQFEIIYYKGTLAPMDFISHISVADKDCHRQIQGKVSMNHIFSYQHYRFYQSGYSEDNEGSVFSVSHDPYGIGITYAGYTLFCAEVASTTNEALLYEFLIKNAGNDKQKAYYITQYLDLIKDTLYIQTMYAEFEKTIHELVENNKSINALVLDDIWGQLLTKYYGKDYELDQLAKVGWSRIPHFYNSFYVYKYATGCSAGVSFAQDILKNGSDNYINFLKKGGSDYPINVLKDAGVNLTSTKPIEDTINKFDSLVKELEKLVSK